MSIKLADFINILKRQSRYGTPSTVDQAQTDILNSINIRGARIWGYKDWRWNMEPLSFAVAPAINAYTVAAASGNPIDRIHSLIPHDTTVAPPVLGTPLQELSVEDFYEKTQQASPVLTGNPPQYYCNLGMDANMAWQILIAPTPSAAFTMTGYAKAVLYTYLAADVTANLAFKYFPNGVILDALLAGCLIDIGMIQGMTAETRLSAEGAWEAKIQHLASEQMGVARDNSPITTPPPPWYTARQRMRSKRGTGVY